MQSIQQANTSYIIDCNLKTNNKTKIHYKFHQIQKFCRNFGKSFVCKMNNPKIFKLMACI